MGLTAIIFALYVLLFMLIFLNIFAIICSGFMPGVLLHIDVNGGSLPTGSSSPDYIDESLEGEKSDGKGTLNYANDR